MLLISTKVTSTSKTLLAWELRAKTPSLLHETKHHEAQVLLTAACIICQNNVDELKLLVEWRKQQQI